MHPSDYLFALPTPETAKPRTDCVQRVSHDIWHMIFNATTDEAEHTPLGMCLGIPSTRGLAPSLRVCKSWKVCDWKGSMDGNSMTDLNVL
jgi:hypothetical protein